MIIPSQPSSSYDGEDQDQTLPPSYQEAVVPPSQRLPSERPNNSLYAPSLSSRFNPPHERERELEPNPDYPAEKTSTPRVPAERSYSVPPSPSKEKEREGSSQRAFDVFSSMVWGTTSTASTSRSPNLASTSNTSITQDPLNPAPDSFTRPTPKNYVYLPFQPMTMLGISSNLADGFPMIPPPINSEDEAGAGKANSQHPFISHDVTKEDWLQFLTGLKTVASTPNQAQKSFLAKLFLGEMNEKDKRKQAIHFIDSWNHYFFQPRRMTVVLARGRKIFGGASGHHRRHSVGHHPRGRDVDPTHTGHYRSRHRSHSVDSSSSSSSESSISSIHSTISEPPEMPVPHTRDPSSGEPFTKEASNEHGPWWMTHANHMVNYGLRYARMSAMSRGGGRGFPGPFHPGWRGGRGGRGFTGPHHPGWHGSRGGRGWCPPGVPGPSMAPQTCEEPWQSPTHRDQKQAWKSEQDEWKRGYKAEKDGWKREYKAEKKAWKAEKRGVKHEHRRMKRAMKHERRQRRREARAVRYGGEDSREDQPWKLIISYHGARRETGQT